MTTESPSFDLRRLIESLPVQVWTATPDGTVDFISGAHGNFPVDSGGELKDEWTSLLHPHDRRRTLARWMHSVTTGEPYEDEFRLFRRDGEYIWHLARAVADRDDSGRIQRWFGSSMDISQPKALNKQLSLLRTAVARVNDIILIAEAGPTDKEEPRTIFVNEAFERRTGYPVEEALGKSPQFLQGPSTQPDELARIRLALESGQPVRALLTKSTKSGEEFWLELDMVPMTEASGRVTHWVGVERDVTQQLLMQRQLHNAQRMETVGHLTGGIAHDFNNLLMVVLGNADMLAEQLAEKPELERLAKMIIQAADRGSNLVRGLLAFARRQVLEPAPVDVHELLEGLTGILRASLAVQHTLSVRIQDGEWPVMVDRAHLESALLNLAINARDAMPEAGELVIRACNAVVDEDDARREPNLMPGHYVMIEVSDTGTGISEADLERIFEPFFTTKGLAKGSGLGLSTVFGFIKQSGGHILVHSEPDGGTCFWLYLPRASPGAPTSVDGEEASVDREEAPSSLEQP